MPLLTPRRPQLLTRRRALAGAAGAGLLLPSIRKGWANCGIQGSSPPPTGSGYPSVGFGLYSVGIADPTIASIVNGGTDARTGRTFSPTGMSAAQFNLVESFSTDWTASGMLYYTNGRMQAASTDPDLAPSTQRHWVIGALTTATTDNSLTPASITAGTNDQTFKDFIDCFYNNGYSTSNGYHGTIYLRINWEINYPGTTPGNYNSSQTTVAGWTQPEGQAYAWGTTGNPSTHTIGNGMFGAWQRMVSVLRSQAALRGVNIKIVWNPALLNSNAGSSYLGGAEYMYPGDAYVDEHSYDIYSNTVYPNGFFDFTGYAAQPPFAQNWPFTTSTGTDVASWLSATPDYSNAMHWYDFTDGKAGIDEQGDTEGPDFGWSTWKAMNWALCKGIYDPPWNNPDGTVRTPKPLNISECGGIGLGAQNGPYTDPTTQFCNDTHFYPYLKSRIAWFQAQGGNFTYLINWAWPDNTTQAPAMAASMGQTWPPS